MHVVKIIIIIGGITLQALVHECEQLTEEKKYSLLEQTIKDFEYREDNLIQILHMAQAIFGFLPMEVQKFIAEKMDISLSSVSGVVTFYSFFSTQPKGKYKIQICLGTACYVRGGKKIIEALKENLGIDIAETTPDKKFSLEVMRCIGACGLAPAISINDKVYKRVNPAKIQEILNEYE